MPIELDGVLWYSESAYNSAVTLACDNYKALGKLERKLQELQEQMSADSQWASGLEEHNTELKHINKQLIIANMEANAENRRLKQQIERETERRKTSTAKLVSVYQALSWFRLPSKATITVDDIDNIQRRLHDGITQI